MTKTTSFFDRFRQIGYYDFSDKNPMNISILDPYAKYVGLDKCENMDFILDILEKSQTTTSFSLCETLNNHNDQLDVLDLVFSQKLNLLRIDNELAETLYKQGCVLPDCNGIAIHGYVEADFAYSLAHVLEDMEYVDISFDYWHISRDNMHLNPTHLMLAMRSEMLPYLQLGDAVEKLCLILFSEDGFHYKKELKGIIQNLSRLKDLELVHTIRDVSVFAEALKFKIHRLAIHPFNIDRQFLNIFLDYVPPIFELFGGNIRNLSSCNQQFVGCQSVYIANVQGNVVELLTRFVSSTTRSVTLENVNFRQDPFAYPMHLDFLGLDRVGGLGEVKDWSHLRCDHLSLKVNIDKTEPVVIESILTHCSSLKSLAIDGEHFTLRDFSYFNRLLLDSMEYFSISNIIFDCSLKDLQRFLDCMLSSRLRYLSVLNIQFNCSELGEYFAKYLVQSLPNTIVQLNWFQMKRVLDYKGLHKNIVLGTNVWTDELVAGTDRCLVYSLQEAEKVALLLNLTHPRMVWLNRNDRMWLHATSPLLPLL